MSLMRTLRCLLVLGIIGISYFAPLQPAHAGYCNSSVNTATFTYTAATISQAQTITINDSWSCSSGSIFYASYSQSVCLYMDAYTGNSTTTTWNGTSYALSYTVYSTAGTGASSPNPAPTSVASGAGLWYGANGGSTVGTSGTTSGPLLSSMAITIPAGVARTVPPGTYTVTIRFTLDMQSDALGTTCSDEGNGGPDGGGRDWGTTTYTFTIVIPKICSIDTVDNIDFGNIAAVNTLGADVTAQGNVYFTCSLSTSYTMYLGDGLNRTASGSGNRNMVGSDGTSRLPYQLYTTSGMATIWDSTTGVSGTGSGAQTFNTVYGKIAAGSTLPTTLGSYQDSVVVTVSY